MSQPIAEFQAAAEHGTKRKTPTPFSLRLSADERALLEARAGSKPLGAFIRAELLSDHAGKRRAFRRPKIDDALLGKVLAALGASRLSSNLNQLARSANIGTLPVTPDVEQELREACEIVAEMRSHLIRALGLEDGQAR